MTKEQAEEIVTYGISEAFTYSKDGNWHLSFRHIKDNYDININDVNENGRQLVYAFLSRSIVEEVNLTEDKISFKLNMDNEIFYNINKEFVVMKMANESKSAYAPEKLQDKDRKLFVENLGRLLRQTRQNIESAELIDDVVKLKYKGGAEKEINVACCSYNAIIYEVSKNI